MQTIIFCVGCFIFVTYMFFLLRMINIAHKQQARKEFETRIRKVNKKEKERV